MLHVVGAATLDDVAGKTMPAAIRSNSALDLPPPIDEAGGDRRTARPGGAEPSLKSR